MGRRADVVHHSGAAVNAGKVCQEFDFDALWYRDGRAHASRDGKCASCPPWSFYDAAEYLDDLLAEGGAPRQPKRDRDWKVCAIASAEHEAIGGIPPHSVEVTVSGSNIEFDLPPGVKWKRPTGGTR
jgi:hypothetical protein